MTCMRNPSGVSLCLDLLSNLNHRLQFTCHASLSANRLGRRRCCPTRLAFSLLANHSAEGHVRFSGLLPTERTRGVEKTPKVERRGKKRRGDSARRDGNSKPCQQTPQKTEAVGALRIVHWPAAAAVSTWSPPCYAVRYRHVSNGQLRACTCLIRLSCCYLYRPAHSWFSPFPRSGVFFFHQKRRIWPFVPHECKPPHCRPHLPLCPSSSQPVSRERQAKKKWTHRATYIDRSIQLPSFQLGLQAHAHTHRSRCYVQPPRYPSTAGAP